MVNAARSAETQPVDIILPVFRQAEFLQQVLHSLWDAPVGPPFEVILIDDASNDEATTAVIERYRAHSNLTVLRNLENLGFTRTVNRGMQLHPDRDVVLLNSDTCVHGDWLDRLRRAAYSAPNIGTVNPLTSQFGSHISSYPGLRMRFEGVLEVGGAKLAKICGAVNDGRYVDVHTTVGFCMFIRRDCLVSIGYFDPVAFPVGYGEESDFCYRARKFRWRHLVAGDVFVDHFEGKSFGARKQALTEAMIKVFVGLHPDLELCDRRFARMDPVYPIRLSVDLERIAMSLGGATTIDVASLGARGGFDLPAWFELGHGGELRLLARLPTNSFPNVPTLRLPADTPYLNFLLKRLRIAKLITQSVEVDVALRRFTSAQPFETRLAAEVECVE